MVSGSAPKCSMADNDDIMRMPTVAIERQSDRARRGEKRLPTADLAGFEITNIVSLKLSERLQQILSGIL